MNYKKQAEDFLRDTNTSIEILKAVPQKRPLWCKENEKHGINYYVTLHNDKHSYSFDYWGSIADREKIEHGEKRNTMPSAYDVLTCLHPYYGDTFEDFCSDFGYVEDSITALKIYETVKKQDSNIKKLWNEEELSRLSEII